MFECNVSIILEHLFYSVNSLRGSHSLRPSMRLNREMCPVPWKFLTHLITFADGGRKRKNSFLSGICSFVGQPRKELFGFENQMFICGTGHGK